MSKWALRVIRKPYKTQNKLMNRCKAMWYNWLEQQYFRVLYGEIAAYRFYAETI